MAELDKFKRRLIRSVARLLVLEHKAQDEVWETLKKETGRECDEIWKRMRALTLKKLGRLLANDDYVAKIGKIARMTHTDWLMFDLVLVYEGVDVITVEGKAPSQQTCLTSLLALAKEFEVDSCPVQKLAATWRELTLRYNLNGRQTSPMLLQLRWHQLKQSTRDVFYDFWFGFRGNLSNIDRNALQRPSELQRDIAANCQDIITKPLPSWKESVEGSRVVPQDEFARLHRSESLASQPTTAENEPDLVMIEPKIDTITIDSDGEMSAKESADVVEENPEDNTELKDPQHKTDQKPAETQDEPNTNETNITNLQEHLGITIKEEPLPLDSLDDLINVIDKRTDKEDGLSNVKILATTHVPTEDIDPPLGKPSTEDIIPTEANSSMKLSKDTDIMEGDQTQQIHLSTEDDLIQVVENDNDTIKIYAATHVPTEDIDSPLGKPSTEDIIPTEAKSSIKLSTDTAITEGDQTQEIDLSLEDDLIQIEDNDTINNTEGEKNILKAILETEDQNNVNKKEKDIEDANNRDGDRDIFFCTKLAITKSDDKQTVDDNNKIEECSVIGELPTNFDVIDDGIEFEDEYDDDNYWENEIDAGNKQESVTSHNIDIEGGYDSNPEDQLEEETTPKFDLKLMMMPVVYTTRLDDMTLFDKETESYESITTESTIAQILYESKPVSHKSIHTKPEIPEIDRTDVVPLINEEKTISDDLINLAPFTASEDERSSSDEEDIERVNPSSSLFQKPKSLNYNPIQLCKNPDFNTKLKRLSVGIFILESNRQHLKTLKPVTIDLHKSFEEKLIDNTIYLKPNPFSDVVTIHDNENVSCGVEPSAMLAQSLVDATTPTVKTDDNEPSGSLAHMEISEEESLLAERKNKVISLPDITKVRRINQHLQTAEVTPIQQSKEDLDPELVLTGTVIDAEEIIKKINKDVKPVIENIEIPSNVGVPECREDNDGSSQETEAMARVCTESGQVSEAEVKTDPEMFAGIEKLTQPSTEINLTGEDHPISKMNDLFEQYINVDITTPQKTIDTVERPKEATNDPLCKALFNHYVNLNNTRNVTNVDRTTDTAEPTREVRNETQIANKAKKKPPRTQPAVPWYKRDIISKSCAWAWESQQTDACGTITGDTLFKMLKFLNGNKDVFLATNDKHATEKLRKEMTSSKIPKKHKERVRKPRAFDSSHNYCCWSRMKIDYPTMRFIHYCIKKQSTCTCCCKEEYYAQKYKKRVKSKSVENDKPDKEANDSDRVIDQDDCEIISAIQEIRQNPEATPKTPTAVVRVVAGSTSFPIAKNHSHKFSKRPLPLQQITRVTQADCSVQVDLPAIEVTADDTTYTVEVTTDDLHLTNSTPTNTDTAPVEPTIEGTTIDVTEHTPVVNNATESFTRDIANEDSIVSSLNTSSASELIVLSDDENNRSEGETHSTSALQPPLSPQLILPRVITHTPVKQTSAYQRITYAEKKGPKKIWKTKCFIKCSAKEFKQSPFDIGEGYVLLTTATIPPEMLNPAPIPAIPAVMPAPISATTPVFPDLVLPAGVQIVVGQTGELICSIQPDVHLDVNQLEEIQRIVTLAQEQLQSSSFPIKPPPPLCPVENTVELPDDIFMNTHTSLISSESTNNVNVSAEIPRKDYESDLPNELRQSDGQPKESVVDETPHLDKQEDGQIENSKAEDCLDSRKQGDASDKTKSKNISLSDDTFNDAQNEFEGLEKKQNENIPEGENITDNKITNQTDEEATSKATVEDKSENITETIDDTADIEDNRQETGGEVKGDGNKKSILSDLMEMSGISSEDFQVPVEPTVESSAGHADNHIGVLTPVTSMNILRYAYEQNASFYKYNLATKQITQIRMTIEKVHRVNTTEEPGTVIDLTDTPAKEPEVAAPVRQKRKYTRRTLLNEKAQQIMSRKRKRVFVTANQVKILPKPPSQSQFPRLEIDCTDVNKITSGHIRVKAKAPIIIRNVIRSNLKPFETQVEPVAKTGRKKPRKEKIEAKICLDSDNPIEEEYLVDSSSDEESQAALKHILLAQAQHVSSDEDVDSDDEPLAKKITRRKRQEERKGEELVAVSVNREYLDSHLDLPMDSDGEDFILGA